MQVVHGVSKEIESLNIIDNLLCSDVYSFVNFAALDATLINYFFLFA